MIYTASLSSGYGLIIGGNVGIPCLMATCRLIYHMAQHHTACTSSIEYKLSLLIRDDTTFLSKGISSWQKEEEMGWSSRPGSLLSPEGQLRMSPLVTASPCCSLS